MKDPHVEGAPNFDLRLLWWMVAKSIWIYLAPLVKNPGMIRFPCKYVASHGSSGANGFRPSVLWFDLAGGSGA